MPNEADDTLHGRVTRLESAAKANADAIAENTSITRQVKADVAAVRDGVKADIAAVRAEVKADVKAIGEAVQPVTDALEGMKVGIRTIGRIGRFTSVVTKSVAFLAGVFILIKVLFLGGSLAEALSEFWRVLK